MAALFTDMLSVTYAECLLKSLYAASCCAECHYVKCRYAECRGATFGALAFIIKLFTV